MSKYCFMQTSLKHMQYMGLVCFEGNGKEQKMLNLANDLGKIWEKK